MPSSQRPLTWRGSTALLLLQVLGRGPLVVEALLGGRGALYGCAGQGANMPDSVRPTTALPPGTPQSGLTGGCGPFPEESCPPSASWAKENKVSSLLSVRWPKAGPRAQASHLQLAPAPPASADSLCSVEAFGSSPASCVINQPEFRQSALGKRNVWCALVFSSNCFMARSARKIFQNKTRDGNYISTLGTDGMRALSALCKKHPPSDRHTSPRPAGAAPGLELGDRGGFSVRSLSLQLAGLWGALEFASHV